MSRIWDTAAELLAAAEAAFASSADPPEIAYVADGSITMEIGPERETGPFSALVVTWDGVRPGDANPIADGYGPLGLFSIYVLRLAPVGDNAGAVAFVDINAAARVICEDAWTVLSAVVDGYSSGELGGICGSASVVAQTPVGPEGGVEGSRLQLAILLT